MRKLVVLVFALGAAGATAPAYAMVLLAPHAAQTTPPAIVDVEYFCSPGFETTSGGRCVAVASRAEVELYDNEPVETRVYRHHRRHRVHARY